MESGDRGMTTYVNFFCQSCHQPLKMDGSMLDLNNSEFEQLLEPLPPSIKAAEPASSPSNPPSGIERTFVREQNSTGPSVQPPRLKPSQLVITSIKDDDSAVSSVSRERQKASLNHRLKVASKLFDLASSRSPIDHPLCIECANKTLDILQKQLAAIEKECACYESYLKKRSSELKNENTSGGDGEEDEESDNKNEVRASVDELNAREKQLIEEITRGEEEKAALLKQLADLQAEFEQSCAEVEEVCLERNERAKEFSEESQLSQMSKIENERLLHWQRRLEGANVWNDVFRITGSPKLKLGKSALP